MKSGSSFVNWNDSCSADTVTLANTIIANTTGRHFDFPPCENTSLFNNLLSNADGTLSARVAGQNHTEADSLNAESFAADNLAGDPLFNTGAYHLRSDSMAGDSGASLEAYYLEFEQTFDASIRRDRDGTPRPSGNGEDIGAFERP